MWARKILERMPSMIYGPSWHFFRKEDRELTPDGVDRILNNYEIVKCDEDEHRFILSPRGTRLFSHIRDIGNAPVYEELILVTRRLNNSGRIIAYFPLKYLSREVYWIEAHELDYKYYAMVTTRQESTSSSLSTDGMIEYKTQNYSQYFYIVCEDSRHGKSSVNRRDGVFEKFSMLEATDDSEVILGGNVEKYLKVPISYPDHLWTG